MLMRDFRRSRDQGCGISGGGSDNDYYDEDVAAALSGGFSSVKTEESQEKPAISAPKPE